MMYDRSTRPWSIKIYDDAHPAPRIMPRRLASLRSTCVNGRGDVHSGPCFNLARPRPFPVSDGRVFGPGRRPETRLEIDVFFFSPLFSLVPGLGKRVRRAVRSERASVLSACDGIKDRYFCKLVGRGKLLLCLRCGR